MIKLNPFIVSRYYVTEKIFFGLVSTLIFIACAPAQLPSARSGEVKVDKIGKEKMTEDKVDKMADSSYEANLNQRVTIHGSARNAMLGAIVKTSDNTPIYIDGITEWDSSILGKSIAVTGVLRSRKLAPDPVVGSNGEHSQGIEGESYVLEKPTWKVDE